MRRVYPDDLRELARLWSIQLEYIDSFNERRVASVETLEAILAARGVAVTASNVREAIDRRRADLAGRVIAPFIAIEAGRSVTVPLRQPAAVSLVSEEGAVREVSLRNGEGTVTFQLSDLAVGYHTLVVEQSSGAATCTVAVKPPRCYEVHGRRFGFFVPAYAIRRAISSPGADLGDLRAFVDWSAAAGASVVSTLPLLASYLDVAFEPSPYAAVSRLFWNEFYVDIRQVPELQSSEEARKKLSVIAPSSSRLVDYAGEFAARREVLELLADAFFRQSGVRRELFEIFVKSRPDVRDYALFRAHTEKRETTWPFWNRPQRDGLILSSDVDASAVDYHLYAQFVIDEQMRELSQHSRVRDCGLVLDFPLGSNSHGYDVWREPDLFVRGASIGAPPDLSYASGQNWGFRPADPDALRQSGYRHWIACIRQQLQRCSMLRLDHVMGLHRLYWIPDGFAASEGAYVEYSAEELYAILAIESVRSSAEIIGEDLGTVPPIVREAMSRHGVRSLHVLQRESTHGQLLPAASVPPSAVTSLNNHDMPPFRAFWEELDIPEKVSLGVIARERESLERAKRDAALSKLRELWNLPPTAGADEALLAALDYLAHCSAELVMVTLEDLWLESESQNIPTTSTERPNWRLKTALSVEELSLHPTVLEALVILRERATKKE